MKNIFLAASVLMLCSCASESSQSGITTVDVASGIKEAKALATSSLFDKVEYIPLETTDESIISKIADIRVMDDYILMSSSGLRIRNISPKGEFVALLYPHEIEGVKINGNLVGDEDNPVVVIMQ
ncbi:MAG: 6-bladed beta-propeller [Tannerellaceae bacterium]